MNTEEQAILENFYGVFDQKIEDVQLGSNDGEKAKYWFNPDSKSAPNQIYTARIKFLTNPFNPSKGIINKQSYGFPTLEGGKIFYVTPKSLGKYEKCDVAQKYFKFRNSEEKRHKDIFKDFTWRSNKIAFIQVIEDYVKPENKGKIFAWGLPQDIEKMIELRLNPTEQMIRDEEVANNVFDIETGFILSLDIPIEKYTDENGKQQEKRVYTNCKFLTKDTVSTTMILDGETEQWKKDKVKENRDEYRKRAIETLLKFEHWKEVDYQAETEEKTQEVLGVLESWWSGTTPTQKPNLIQKPTESTPTPTEAKVETTTETKVEAKVETTTEAKTETKDVDAGEQVYDELFGGNKE